MSNLLKGKGYPICCIFCQKETWHNVVKQHIRHCIQNPEFGIPCKNCGKMHHPKNKTCSTGCYNALHRKGLNNPNATKKATYRTICFHHWGKKCCLCGFEFIVEAHHIDCNHHNNDPNNLAPLCPNHHQMMHSKYKELLVDQFENYIKRRG